MKAIIYKHYGPPEVLHPVEMAKPKPGENEILILIKATAVNSGDWRVRKADPFMVRLFFGLLRPKKQILGSVLSGVVEETGRNAGKFSEGDEVFGLTEIRMGTYAEYISLPEDLPLAPKPHNLTHNEAAAIPFGAHTALHFLRKAGIENKSASGSNNVLIYGASGAVGTAAVQLAKHFGAEVTGVCSTANVEMVRSLGADRVIDYLKKNPLHDSTKYDIIFETVNKASSSSLLKMLKRDGRLILGSAMAVDMLTAGFTSMGSKKKVITGVAKVTADDMQFIRTLVEAGRLKPVIDRTYQFEEMAEAHAYVEKGHKKGNVVVKVSD